MKILLISPTQSNVYGCKMLPAYPPLGFLYIGAALEEIGENVEFIDMDADGVDFHGLAQLIAKIDPELVGISFSTPMFNPAMKVAGIVKSIKNIPVVVGGIHPTIDPQSCAQSKDIDFISIGEGEETVKELISCIKEGKDFSGIKGIWYRKEGAFIKNPPRDLADGLDKISPPARHLLKNPKKYMPSDAITNSVVPIITSRGCPAQCSFCCTKQIFGRRVRFHSIKSIVQDMQECMDKFNAKEFHILDDCFTVNKKRVLDFCEEVKAKGFKNLVFSFPNGLRADQVDYQVLKALKEIGTYAVGFGVESADEEVIRRCKKGSELNRIKEAFDTAKKLGLVTWGFFMIGLPGETDQSVRKTIDFALKLDPDFAKFLILKPYPGSEVFNELKADNLIMDFNYDNYGVYTPPVHKLPGMSAEKMLEWQKKANRSFYFRPKKIFQRLGRIKSFTQLKWSLERAVFIFREA